MVRWSDHRESSVLIAVERLLVRLRQVPSRADELITLRGRIRQAAKEKIGIEERALAREVRALKVRASAALAETTACHSCAAGKRWPRGAHAGGDCCSGVTADLFDDDEVGALAAAGTRPRDLTAPRGDHAGCAFRGELGCTLAAADRPMRCVHYTCMILRRELKQKTALASTDAILTELKGRMAELVALREARLEAEMLAPLEEALSRLDPSAAGASVRSPRSAPAAADRSQETAARDGSSPPGTPGSS